MRVWTVLLRLSISVMLGLSLLAHAPRVGASAAVRQTAATRGFPVRMINQAEGLPHPSVYSIARDPFGFFWFGTLEGLTRYDGHRFVTYQPAPNTPNAPSSAQIDTLYSDRAGMLWIGTLANGLNRYDPYREQFSHYRHDPADPTSLGSDAVRAIHEDPMGALWVGTLGGGLNRLDPTSGRFTRYQHNPADPTSLSHNHVTAILDDGQGGLWVATAGGLNRFDPVTASFTVYRHKPADPNALGGDRVTALLRDHDGTLWVGVTGAGLYRYDAARDQFSNAMSDAAELRSKNIVALAETHSGALWVATYGGGLYRFDLASGHFSDFNRLAQDGSGIPTENIESLFPSADGLLLVGTEDRGVALVDLNPGPFTVYTAHPDPQGYPQIFPPGVIRAVREDVDGALWLGVTNAGLVRFDRARNQIRTYRHDPTDVHSPSGRRAQALLIDRNDTLWIGYSTGFDRYDRAGDRFVRYPVNPDDPAALGHGDIYTLHEDATGALWLGTRGGGAYRLDPVSGRFTSYRHDPADPTSISSNNIGAIISTPDGALWFGSESAGLSRLDPATGRFTNYRHDPNNPSTPGSNTMPVLTLDPDGILWGATWNSGLDRIDPTTGQIKRYTVADGLLSGKINGIQSDDDGRLWLAMNQGLMHFDPRTGKSVAYPDVSVGLPFGGFALNGTARTRAGELILGGFDALVTFFPNQVRPQTAVAPVVFTSVLLANRPVPVGASAPLTTTINAASGLSFAYDDQVLTLEFAALDYRAPASAHYRYRLVGFESNWVEVDHQRRLATYTNLDPGVYRFELQAANGEGVWGNETRRLNLTVVPPWWQTWWFTLLSSTALLSMVLVGVGLWWQGEQRQRQRLEDEVAIRTAALASANTSLERQVHLERTLIMSLDLDTLLGSILDQIGEVVPFSSGAIFTLDAQTLTLRALRSEILALQNTPLQLDLSQIGPLYPILEVGTTQILKTVEVEHQALHYVGAVLGQPVIAQAWLVVPLLVQERLIGLLVLAHPQADSYGPSEVAQLEPFVSPVALALENDRLRQQAQSAATLAERARVARELHDAVTQTLFSASLIAEALPDALARSPERAIVGADELRRLTTGALAEMRTLLLELRPKALTEMSLGRLVQLLAASLRSHSPVTITVTIANDWILEPAVQLACYRIAQEALNNAVKHAAAAEVTVSVACSAAEVRLQVRDNGCGFDPDQLPQGGLGLSIMQERACEIGAQFMVSSAPDAGTTVTLHWQAGNESAPLT